MSTTIEIPYTLASLPKPFDATNGKTYASPVYNYKAGKRRKRPEVAVGVDGDGLHLYNVQSPRLIASYALSPQTRFACSPSSIYCRKAGQNISHLLTYAVLSEGNGNTSDLVCYAEEIAKKPTLDPLTSNNSKRAIQLEASYGPAHAIVAVPLDATGEDASAFDVCIVFANGAVACYSGDLEKTKWHVTAQDIFNPGSQAVPKSEIEYASLMSLDSARKGLLKSREDVLADLTDAAHGAQLKDQYLLVLLTAAPKDRKSLHVIALPRQVRDSITTLQQGPREILTYLLPKTPAGAGQSSPIQYCLHGSGSTLQQLSSGAITTYDLSKTIPTIVSHISKDLKGFAALLQLSSSIVLAVDSDTCGVYDTLYSSTQATLLLDEGQKLGKGKRTSIDQASLLKSSHLVSYWQDAGLVVALRNGFLLGMQVSTQPSSRKRAKLHPSLLADSLGKGNTMSNQNQGEKWTQWTSQIDELVRNNDVVAFEGFLANDLKVPITKSYQQPNENPDVHENASVNGDHDAEMQLQIEHLNSQSDLIPENAPSVWRFDKNLSALAIRTQRRKALYCLGKMFGIPEDSEGWGPVRVTFYAPNVFKWLALTGYLSVDLVNHACSESGRRSRVEAGDVVKALVSMDPSLRVMHELLTWPVSLELREIVQALQAVIRSLESPQAPEQQRIAPELNADAPEMDGPSEQNFSLESEAAEADLAFALASLNDGLAIRSLVLRAVLNRLHSYAAPRVVEAFKAALSPREIVFLITLLRIELADGGWTTRYNDEAEDGDGRGEGPSDHSITVISDLLNMAIDAVGTSGWLVGLSGDTQLSTDDMLLILRAETSAALEGCLEATSLSTILNDFERYQSRTLEKQGVVPRKRKVDPLKNPGFLVEEDIKDPSLPLGYKVDRIDKTRTTKGGLVKTKSKGAMGKEISMRVGEYSIDRIRV